MIATPIPRRKTHAYSEHAANSNGGGGGAIVPKHFHG